MKEHDDTVQPSQGREGADGATEAEAVSAEAAPVTPEVVEAPPIDLRSAEIAELRRRLDDTTGKLKAVSKAYTELESDNDSYRRRMAAQADQRVERKAGEVVEKFFEPVQNLKRSLEAGKSDPSGVLVGLEMVVNQFTEVLRRLGLEEVPGLGSTFDPNIHEALAIAPVSDPALDGKVVDVYATGWRIGTKVLQPAQVVIGKLGEAAEA